MHIYESSANNSIDRATSEPTALVRPKVAIIGARGYSGLELARILLRHPQAELAGCFATDVNSFRLAQLLPEESAASVPTWPIAALESHLSGLHTVFLATPAEASLELAPRILNRGVNVIDLSGAYRLKQGTNEVRTEKYLQWYGFRHTELDLLASAEYGLHPWMTADRMKVKADTTTTARLIANPGCYATATLMACLPLLKSGLIQPESLVIDAKSGTTGGGRKASESLLFTEVDGECLPYKVGKHQHWPEIVEAAQAFSGASIAPFFTTHLLNVRRGIVASIYARLSPRIMGTNQSETEARVLNAYEDAYEGYGLVRFGALGRPETDSLLSLKRVVGTPRTHISFRADGDHLYVFSLIDNLVKGAASQAVENFNRLLDRPCDFGLSGMEGVL